MKKRICFFSVGFAFNRLNRMRFYEKIFPKNVEIFLFTTNKYHGSEKQNYQFEWTGLKRTKILVEDFSFITLPFKLRKFCRKNKIDRVMNLGAYFGAPIVFLASFFTKTDYILNVFSDIFYQYQLAETKLEFVKQLATLYLLFPFMHFSKKINFTDELDSKRAPYFFLTSKNKSIHLAAPVDIFKFFPKNKSACRKKLSIPLNSKIVIFVGRINFLKCSDIFEKLVEENPNITFLAIGKLFHFSLKKFSNFVHYEKISPEELVNYYSASDISFCVNRGGGGIGISTEEALACGVPVLVSEHFKLKPSSALFQVKFSLENTQKFLQYFFKLSPPQKKIISKEARKYVIDNYSYEVWKNKYLQSYLK